MNANSEFVNSSKEKSEKWYMQTEADWISSLWIGRPVKKEEGGGRGRRAKAKGVGKEKMRYDKSLKKKYHASFTLGHVKSTWIYKHQSC